MKQLKSFLKKAPRRSQGERGNDKGRRDSRSSRDGSPARGSGQYVDFTTKEFKNST